MINELHNLSKSLESDEITVDEWHRKYITLKKVTAKSPCIRIWLDHKGMVCDMESLSPEQAGMIRKYGDNQSSFPAFNISPLFRITESDEITELEKIKTAKSIPNLDIVRTWCQSDNWIKGASEQVKRSMMNCSSELVKLCRLENQENIITELAYISKKASDDFRQSLENCIFEKLQKQEDIPLMILLLFHIGDASKEHSKDTGVRISVVLDVYNWDAYGCPVASEQTTKHINDLLLRGAAAQQNNTKPSQTDAFGALFINPEEPMPSVKVSGFEITLRSMFAGQPCQYRYNKIEDKSYPIGTHNRASLKKALEWIAKPSNQHITWVKVDKDEIAFIYPSKLPQVPLKFASMLGGEKTVDPKQTECRFESISKAFAQTFQGMPPEQKPDSIQIFTIRKMDKARSKVLFTHNSTPTQLMTAAENWSAGCNNLPDLDTGAQDTPFPLEVADILNAVWKQDGQRADGKSSVKRMKYYEGVELLLDALPTGVVVNSLHIAVENFSGLFMYLGNLLHKGKYPDEKSGDKKLESKKIAAGQSLIVLGLLLYKCNERKQNYMDKLAFLLGQWLHVSDELHTLYCKVKRDGDIPPQLAGSALLVSAGDMPYQALAQLYSRMNPFTAWAKQYRHQNIDTAGQESWRAGWLLGLYEMLADKINPQMEQSLRFGDFEKAQLYIGYMGSLPKKEKPLTVDNNIAGGMENEQGN